MKCIWLQDILSTFKTQITLINVEECFWVVSELDIIKRKTDVVTWSGILFIWSGNKMCNWPQNWPSQHTLTLSIHTVQTLSFSATQTQRTFSMTLFSLLKSHNLSTYRPGTTSRAGRKAVQEDLGLYIQTPLRKRWPRRPWPPAASPAQCHGLEETEPQHSSQYVGDQI